MLKLRDWIDINKINWNGLSYNPNAIELLKKKSTKNQLGSFIRKSKCNGIIKRKQE